jgi:MFS family permease
VTAGLVPLRVKGFSNLAFAYGVNELGNWLGEIALAVLVYDATHSTLATAALFFSMQVLPSLPGPLLVARVETFPARALLPVLYAGEAAAFVALAALSSHFSLAAVLVIAAFDGLLASAARSITRATVAGLLVGRDMLREGNSILNLLFTIAAAAGPALGGLLVAGTGTDSALLVDAGSFAGAALLVWVASGLPESSAADTQWRERLRSGFAYVRAHPALRALLGAQAAALVFFAAVIPIEVAFAKHTLGSGDFGYGALLASWGVGTVAGAVLFAGLRRGSLRVLLGWSSLAVAVAYLLTGVAPSLALACGASLLGGAGNGVQYVTAVTAAQEMTAPVHQARVASFIDVVSRVAPGAGFILGGAVAAAMTPRASYLVAGAGILAVLAIAGPRVVRHPWSSAPATAREEGTRQVRAKSHRPRAA